MQTLCQLNHVFVGGRFSSFGGIHIYELNDKCLITKRRKKEKKVTNLEIL